jgi:hypothetical protein
MERLLPLRMVKTLDGLCSRTAPHDPPEIMRSETGTSMGVRRSSLWVGLVWPTPTFPETPRVRLAPETFQSPSAPPPPVELMVTVLPLLERLTLLPAWRVTGPVRPLRLVTAACASTARA